MDFPVAVSPFNLGTWTAILGLLSSAFKRIFSYLLSLLVMNVSVDGFPLADAVIYFCQSRMWRTPFSGRMVFKGSTLQVRKTGEWVPVVWESLAAAPILFWYRWCPILIFKKEVKSEHGFKSSLELHFLRFTLNPEKLLTDALHAYEAEDRRRVSRIAGSCRFRIEKKSGNNGRGDRMSKDNSPPSAGPSSAYRHWASDRLVGWHEDDLGEPVRGPSELSLLALPSHIEEAVKSARWWLDSEEWFKARRLPWRLGWMLVGPPGTGKTSLVRAVAQHLDLPLFSFDLGSMTNQDFETAWYEMKSTGLAMVLFEDMDSVFHGRDNIHAGQGFAALSFDCVLNAVAGVAPADGVFLVITTNCLAKIDAALGQLDERGRPTRPGRIDRILELKELTPEGRRKVAMRIMGEYPDLVELAVQEGAEDTGAQFQDRCAFLALTRFWEEFNGQSSPH